MAADRRCCNRSFAALVPRGERADGAENGHGQRDQCVSQPRRYNPEAFAVGSSGRIRVSRIQPGRASGLDSAPQSHH